MRSHVSLSQWVLLMIICSISSCLTQATLDHNDQTKITQDYIVYMGERPLGEFTASSLHLNTLQKVIGSASDHVSESLLHSYHRSFNGFLARLTQEQVQTLAGTDGVVSIFLNEKRQLHTTRSWDFMGFPKQVTRVKGVESNIIIGMLDTGIWPESESFSDDGFGPPPTNWKGSCQNSSDFSCNNKIIGAKFYRANGEFHQGDVKSPRDTEGHGTHTSSTAAGAFVSGASLSGFALGTARGGVPSSRIAVYKVCWSDGCYDADILAAFDDAIADGVDIISISVGGSEPKDYFNDSIAIGSFHAMKKGILTSISAGNSGPSPATVVNFSPWSLSVAASTIDRKFLAKVKLGNGETYEGVAINTYETKKHTIIYGGDAPNSEGGYNSSISRLCEQDSLDKTLVEGKIVLCDGLNNASGATNAGAVGSIMQGNSFRDVAFNFPIPATYLDTDDGNQVFDYYSNTRKPTAKILKSTQTTDDLAPLVVSFSSRGPNPITSDILKPDLAAPGVDILAAWTQANSEAAIPFNIISGTSMACPHATAVAAYVKSFHPSWSPSALMSALKTTAFPMRVEQNSDAEFAYGSGHINPVKARDPGLVYDAGIHDYIGFLCGQGYNTTNLRLITGDKNSCSASTNGSVWNLNYPSFTLSAKSGHSITRKFHRTVTNVGLASSTYKAIVKTQPGMKVRVTPKILCFDSVGEKKSFMVRVRAKMSRDMISSSLVWDDGSHQVRSPIVAYVPV
ncbi:hypothetical protein ACFE04_001970 [Oxalis oulophora]